MRQSFYIGAEAVLERPHEGVAVVYDPRRMADRGSLVFEHRKDMIVPLLAEWILPGSTVELFVAKRMSDDPFVRRLLGVVDQLIDRKQLAWNTLRMIGQISTEQAMRNREQWLLATGLESVRLNRPAVVVCPGPSLPLAIGQIDPRKAIIIAVARAVDMLHDAGINPHMVIQEEPRAIKGVQPDCSESVLLLPDQAHKRWWHCSALGRISYMSPLNMFSFWLRQRVAMRKAIHDTSGSVGCDAVSIAHMMGCNPIISCGLDLAIGETVYADSRQEQTEYDQEHMATVPGYNGGFVKTLYNYKVFREWMIKRIATLRAHGDTVRFVNATGGGASIPGMEQMSMGDAMGICDGSVDPMVVLRALRSPAVDTLGYVDDAIAVGSDLCRAMLKAGKPRQLDQMSVLDGFVQAELQNHQIAWAKGAGKKELKRAAQEILMLACRRYLDCV